MVHQEFTLRGRPPALRYAVRASRKESNLYPIQCSSRSSRPYRAVRDPAPNGYLSLPPSLPGGSEHVHRGFNTPALGIESSEQI